PDDQRAGHGTGREDALLVENTVIREFVLEAQRRDLAVVDEGGGVIELAVLTPGRTDDSGRAGSHLARELLDRRLAVGGEGRFQHQVFGRIAGDEQFGRNDEVGAHRGRFVARLLELGKVARDVAHGRVELRQRDDQPVGHDEARPRLSSRNSRPSFTIGLSSYATMSAVAYVSVQFSGRWEPVPT